MRVTIFYSWQSALPNNTNRGFIERALNKAVESIKAEVEMAVEPCIERDVQGIPGTPDIAQTIFRKIDECRIFVGDVSIINSSATTDRETPNPNVLIELGYAAKALTWNYVVCVYNTAFGGVKDLPFDLQTRLMCTYSASEEQDKKSEERDVLASKLKAALIPMLRQITHKVVEDSTPKPLTSLTASEKVKEFLADDRHRIQLSELVMNQGNELAQQIVGPEFPVEISSRISEDDLKQRVQRYQEISQVALAILVAGCYFGSKAHAKLWTDLLQRVANPQAERSGQVVFLDLRRYPALLLLYGGGMATVAGEHYETLLALLTIPNIVNERYGQDMPPFQGLSPYRVLDNDTANLLTGRNCYAPMSEHFFAVLREPFRVLLPDERQYQRCFDRFEYLRTLLEVDLLGEAQSIGCFGWRRKFQGQDVMKQIEAEEGRVGRNWPAYQAGWFNGQRERFMAAKKKVSEVIAQLRWH
jgi:hypothetical protein